MTEQQGPEFPEPDRCEFCGQTFEPFWGPFWYGGFWLCEGCYDDYSHERLRPLLIHTQAEGTSNG
jgi:hypothetical protein